MNSGRSRNPSRTCNLRIFSFLSLSLNSKFNIQANADFRSERVARAPAYASFIAPLIFSPLAVAKINKQAYIQFSV